MAASLDHSIFACCKSSCLCRPPSSIPRTPVMISASSGQKHSSGRCCSRHSDVRPHETCRLNVENKWQDQVVPAIKSRRKSYSVVDKNAPFRRLGVDRNNRLKGLVSGTQHYALRSTYEHLSDTNLLGEFVERLEMVLQNDLGSGAEDYKRRAEFFSRIHDTLVALRLYESQKIQEGADPSSLGLEKESLFSSTGISFRREFPNGKGADVSSCLGIVKEGSSASNGGKARAELGIEEGIADEIEEVLTLEDLMMEQDDGVAAADYQRRAAIFGWSAELVTSSNEQRQTSRDSPSLGEQIRKFEDALVLEKDDGVAASDYSRRAAIFRKNAQLLLAACNKQAEKRRAAGQRLINSHG